MSKASQVKKPENQSTYEKMRSELTDIYHAIINEGDLVAFLEEDTARIKSILEEHNGDSK